MTFNLDSNTFLQCDCGQITYYPKSLIVVLYSNAPAGLLLGLERIPIMHWLVTDLITPALVFAQDLSSVHRHSG